MPSGKLKMKNYIYILLLSLSSPLLLAVERSPVLLSELRFNSNSLSKAVNHYISIGEMQTITELKKATKQPLKLGSLALTKQERDERIGWLCRILFQAEEGKLLRPPKYGELSLPTLTMPAKLWPLYPIAETEGVYLILSDGFAPGKYELASDYIDYCRTEGKFRTVKIKEPTNIEADKALNSLISSERWKAIKWVDKTKNRSYKMNINSCLNYLRMQTKNISSNK